MADTKKYEFVDGDTKIIAPGLVARRIRALVAIAGAFVQAGELGGYIADEEHLAQVSGDAWVYSNALVYGNARVSGDAHVSGNARVYGDAQVYGNARVYGDAQVYGNARVYGDTRIYDDARVSGDAWVSGNAWVSGPAEKTPLQVGGLTWHVTIIDKHMQIGCQYHTLEAWRDFDDKTIAAMEGREALRFWRTYKDTLLSMAVSEGRLEHAIAPRAVEAAPRVPADVIQAVSRYGDARADGLMSGDALGDAIKSMRQWAASLATPPPEVSEPAGAMRDESAENILNSWLDNQHPDDVAVDAFASKMRIKMAAARAKGRGGWNDKSQCSATRLSEMLREHVEKGDPVDVANFAMMLSQREERIASGAAISDMARLLHALERVVEYDWAYMGKDADIGNPDNLYSRVREGRAVLKEMQCR